MSGILEIAPAGVPDAALRPSAAAKDRSIGAARGDRRNPAEVHGRNPPASIFKRIAVLLKALLAMPHGAAPRHRFHGARQDRAIAEQESDIAPTASIARLSPVPGAACAAVREEAAMSISATEAVTAAVPQRVAGARAAWWRSLPPLFSRLRRALHASRMSGTGDAFAAYGARPVEWSFARQAREFAVPRRRQSGGSVRPPRVPRP